MRHESRVNFRFHTFLVVITFSHLAFSSYFNPFQKQKKPLVISSLQRFKNSIKGDSLKQMVPIELVDSSIVVDLKYASANNFTGEELYYKPTAFLRRSAALLLKKVNQELALSGLKIKVFDVYRPWSVTKRMWNLVHDERYAANPAKGSGHNRGAALDVTIVKLSSNEELPMPTAFDDFTEKAHHNYNALPADIIANRALLRKTMENYGFVALETEWWHYSLPNASSKYELLDLEFSKLKKVFYEKN